MVLHIRCHWGRACLSGPAMSEFKQLRRPANQFVTVERVRARIGRVRARTERVPTVVSVVSSIQRYVHERAIAPIGTPLGTRDDIETIVSRRGSRERIFRNPFEVASPRGKFALVFGIE